MERPYPPPPKAGRKQQRKGLCRCLRRCRSLFLRAFGGLLGFPLMSPDLWKDKLRHIKIFKSFFFFFFYLWLCWVFVSVRGLSPVAASGGHTSSRCAGLSLSRPLLLWSTGSRRAGSAIVAHGPSHSAACGIFPDQGPNPCPLHWQADSQPLRHQGSPKFLRVYLSKTQFKSISAKPEVVRSSLKEIISSGEKYLYG